MRVKSRDPAEEGRVIARRNRLGARQPAEDLVVLRVEQRFEIVELGLGQSGDLGVDETAHQNIHLAHAATPGANFYAPSADVGIV